MYQGSIERTVRTPQRELTQQTNLLRARVNGHPPPWRQSGEQIRDFFALQMDAKRSRAVALVEQQKNVIGVRP
jgi:hypothetical protein